MNQSNDLFVVGIGASVGGLDAINLLFENLPNNTGMAFIIVQHLSPDYKSLMPELLTRHTKMKIYTAEHNQLIEPNCIYLNQSSKNIQIKDKNLQLVDINHKTRLNLPVDILFQSLANELKEKTIAIILSGTGSDGSKGIQAIKEVGGTIIVQEPTSAQFDGMPNAAITTNMVDFILDPAQIGALLPKLNQTLIDYNASTIQLEEYDSNDELFVKILREIHKTTGIDFKDYKRNTLVRRLEKRLHITGYETLKDYYLYFINSPEEKEILKQDFLIGVTSFFRDAEAFNILKEKVIPEICKHKADDEMIRIWIPGCSSGEEVFTTAILFSEYLANHDLNIDFKIFATDVDSSAIGKASSGSFNFNIVNEIDKEYLEKYFVNMGPRMEISKEIREKIVFSTHNILKDPPFIHMDLISCRNLLIYLDANVQKKVMSNFQFALNKFGYLFLGNSESLGDIKKHFEQIDSKWKIYQNISDAKPVAAQHSILNKISHVTTQAPYKKSEIMELKVKENPESVFHRYLSNKYSPSCIFIDKNFNILFIKGDAGKKLVHTEGLFERNLLKVVDSELASVIRNGINHLDNEKKEVVYRDIVHETDHKQYTYNLSFYHPENTDLQETYIIEFSEDREIDDSNKIILENIKIDDYSKQRIAFLEDELKSVKNQLQNVIEELETSNEELQSSNEELMSSNEELQGTNEELQSANEELYTVNAEFQEKNKELNDLNNDINNLLNSTDIGTLFLDIDLKIRKFTPAFQKHFNLRESDLGRPIASFASNFSETVKESILKDSQRVLTELVTIEKEITDNDNNKYLKRISPFITADKKIDGVVITFVDITKLKEAEQKILSANQRLELANSVSENAIWEMDFNANRMLNTNKIWDDLYGIDNDNISSQWEQNLHEDDKERTWKSIQDHFEGRTEKYFHEFRYRNPKTGVERWISNVGKVIEYNSDGSPARVLGVSVDITNRKQIELDLAEVKRKIEESEKNFKIIATSTPDHILVQDLDLRYTMVVNPQMGLTEREMIGKTDFDFLNNNEALKLTELKKQVLQTGEAIRLETSLHNKAGELEYFSGSYVPKYNTENQIDGLVGYFSNISDRVKIENELIIEKEIAEKNEKKYKSLFTSMQEGVYLHEIVYDNEGKAINYRIIDANPISEKYLSIKTQNAIGKLATELFGTSEAPFLDIYARVAETGEPYTFNQFFEPMGKHFLISVFSPQKGQFATAFSDITDSKNFEKELFLAKEKAEESDRFKTAFLQNISHEIRTPLNAIMGFSELLSNVKEDKEKLSNFSSIIVRRSNDLLDIINDIIDISKIESGQLPLNIEFCNLGELFTELNLIATDLLHALGNNKINLKLSVEDNAKNTTLKTDKGKLKQVLINLISNAIKYTEQGKVQFGYKTENEQIIFYVFDTGIGFSEDNYEVIFERFVRLQNSTKANIGGTGLGLSIVKGLVNLMGGNIWVESEPNKGSKFYFTVSYSLIDVPQLNKGRNLNPIKITPLNKKVLVVEDDIWNAQYISEVLSLITNKISIAENGCKAIELIRDNNYDIVLMDIRLPDMTGYDVITEIKKIKPLQKIIVQTAYASSDERTKALNYGCVDYISKPIKEQVLIESVYSQLMTNSQLSSISF